LVIANENRNSKDFKKLIDIYNSILDIDPSNQDALNAKEEIIPKAATYISDIFSRAQTEFRNKNYIRTELLCSEVLRIEPDDENAKRLLIRSEQLRLDYAQQLWQQGDEALKNKEYNNAKDLFLKAIQNNSSKAQYAQSLQQAEEKLAAQKKYQTANELVNESQFNQAEKLISELLEKYPGEKQYLDLLATFQQKKSRMVTFLLQDGIRLYSQDKLEDALKKFDELLKIDKENQIGNDYKTRIQEKILALKK
jgi:tetratricopeptide (TPR) repeat protein